MRGDERRGWRGARRGEEGKTKDILYISRLRNLSLGGQMSKGRSGCK